MNKTISVIIPVYNVEKYLDRCLESVVNQTYKNLEIILVDDESPDNCPQMCDAWAKKDSRIKVIHKENQGVSAARNAALDIATGDYITFVDSDDYIALDMMEKLLSAAEQDSADAVVCGVIFDYGTHQENEKFVTEHTVYRENEIIKRYIASDIRAEICSKLLKRSLMFELRFDTSIAYSEDLLFNYRFFQRCSTVSCIGDFLYYYDKSRENSATNLLINDAIAKSYLTTKVLVTEHKNDELYDIAVWRHMRKTFVILDKIAKCGDRYYFDTYYDIMKREILPYKAKILTQKCYGPWQKLSTLLLLLPPKLAIKLIKIVL